MAKDSDYDDEIVALNQYVQSGRQKTAKQILACFGNEPRVVKHIGHRVRRKMWTVGDFQPSEHDLSACAKPGQGREKAHLRIGQEVVTKYPDDLIKVCDSFKSDFLAEVKNGICTGSDKFPDNHCGERLTLGMQNELKLSKPVRCKACKRRLWGPGE